MAESIAGDTQALHDEQIRLRAEVELLRRQQEQLQRQLAEKLSPDRGDKDKDEKKSDDQKDKKEEKPKEPFFTRARNWVRTHPLATILIIIGIILLVIAGIFLINYLNSYENTDDAEVDGHTDPISPRISGDVIGVYVENTQHVQKGQVLVDLDPRDYKVALAQANANLSQAEAALRAQSPNVPITTTVQQTQVTTANLDVASAEAGLVQAQQTAASAAADLTQAETNAANAAREEERTANSSASRKFRGNGMIKKPPKPRRNNLSSPPAAPVPMLPAKLSNNASPLSAKPASASWKPAATYPATSLFKTLPSPLASRTSKPPKPRSNRPRSISSTAKSSRRPMASSAIKTVEVGQHLAPGQEMFAVTESNDIWVTANFKETQIVNMHPGQPVTIHVDALSQDFNGYVEALPGATGATYSLLPPENATGNYVKVVQRLQVRLRFKPKQRYAERLHPGLSVEPKVWVNQ